MFFISCSVVLSVTDCHSMQESINAVHTRYTFGTHFKRTDNYISIFLHLIIKSIEHSTQFPPVRASACEHLCATQKNSPCIIGFSAVSPFGRQYRTKPSTRPMRCAVGMRSRNYAIHAIYTKHTHTHTPANCIAFSGSGAILCHGAHHK